MAKIRNIQMILSVFIFLHRVDRNAFFKCLTLGGHYCLVQYIIIHQYGANIAALNYIHAL